MGVEKIEKVMLGNTGIEVSRVGFGVLPIGESQLKLPICDGANLIVEAVRCGINFFDTAEYYKTYPYIREALSRLTDDEKKDIVISSKSLRADYEGMKTAIDDARKSLDRDVIDIFLLHEVRSGEFAERSGAFKALIEAKDKGLVRAIGVSTHHIDVVSEIADVSECDVVFALLNYTGMGIRYKNEAGTKEDMFTAIKKCKQNGKGVFTMKALGGGNLTGHYQEALDYVFSKKEIDSVMVGFGNISELDDMRRYLSKTMPRGYNPDVAHKKIRVNVSDCMGCGACIRSCNSKAISYNNDGFAFIDSTKCISCGYCAYACPYRAIVMY